ncbi:MAG: patatin-like phospholipase family protein [Candidatus Omnitrophica bacterium]|nr:patatin-like phospholipase family protein [Candidatus Omnitrophota bacterium]
MEPLDKNLILDEIPLFASLSDEELNLVREKSTFVEHKKGEVIYKQGSPADAFYCIILGRVVISSRDHSGNDIILEYLHRGKYFGIISLLTAEPHSVTAKAVNDSLILVIKKDDFNFVLNSIPKLAIDLSRTLSRRLKNKDIHQKTIFESTIISAFSSYSQAGKTVYALNLSLGLKRETRKSVLALDICPSDKTHSLPQKLDIKGGYPAIDLSSDCSAFNTIAVKDFIIKDAPGIDLVCISYHPEDESCARKLTDILSTLVNDYHYIILDLPSLMDRFVLAMLNQSDFIHILTSPEAVDLKRTRNLIERLKEDFRFPEDKIKVIINEYKFSRLAYQEQMDLLNHQIFATLPKIELIESDILVSDDADSEYAKAIRRIARQVGDCFVGLALGIGVAYGFCHIGVLKVIEEEKIPIDVICGSSIGALIASLWVTGRSSSEILEIMGEFREPKNIWNMVDLTFPFLGFIKGNKLHHFLKKYLGNKTFYDVRLPLKIIASDVKRKEPKILDKGLLSDAIMASCAMPGVFAPFKFKEDILFDGGVISPLPTEPLLKMGAKKIIAVNVTPSREDILRQYEKIKEGITIVSPESPKKKSWLNIKNRFQENFKTNILDIIFSSIEILQSEVAQKEAQLADVVLHPDTSGLHWLELHRSKDFAKRGEEETRRNLARIWQVINE